MTIGIETTTRNNMATAVLNAIDAGSAAGLVRIYGGQRVPTADDTTDPNAWQADTSYDEGDLIQPTSDNGHYYRATTGGTSGSSEPTWPTDGSTVSDGDMEWEDYGELPLLLGTITASDPAGTVADGTLTFDSLTSDPDADADGEATWARIEASDGTTVADLDVTAEGGGGEIELNTTTVVAGGEIELTGLTITVA